MVSLTLGLLLVAALAVLFSNISASRSELEKSTRQIENGRFALEILTNELRHAGYFGALTASDLPPASGSLPDPCSNDLADVRGAMGWPIQAYGSGSGLTCLSNYQADTAVLVVRRASTVVGITNGFFHLQVSGCANDTQKYLLLDSSTAADFTLHSNRQGNTLGGCFPIESNTPKADISAYLTRIFYVSQCSQLTSGGTCADDIPTLKRVDIKTGATVVTPLVEGIENLQYTFGEDSAGNDGVPEIYTATPGSWQNVMSVEVNLLSRNLSASPGYQDNKTYQLGATSASPGGAFKRHVYSELVRLNNPAGRRE